MPLTDAVPQTRILMIAYSVHPHKTMEDRNGWHRAIQAARHHCVVVMCSSESNLNDLNQSVPETLKERIEFVPIHLGKFGEYCLSTEKLFYVGYRSWLRKATQEAIKRHEVKPFSLSHLVSLCGFRETGRLWKLGCPSIIGPIGGTSGFRISYLKFVDCYGGMFEILRNAINGYQTRFSFRVRKAIRNSTVVIAANSSTRDDLQHYTVQPIRVSLETGIDYPIHLPKTIREADKPLQILWTGRLRAWKALPLLLHAIAKLPVDVQLNLRVVGDGKSEHCWKRVARALKIDQRIEWIRRPGYRDSLRYYREADVFAFTSLRDTSGTGLLEALTAGTPIIGLNHQGAADIITKECGVPISVHNPSQSVNEFRDAIHTLYHDTSRLKLLSDGALLRAKEFQWSSYEDPMNAVYQQVIEHSRNEMSKLTHRLPKLGRQS